MIINYVAATGCDPYVSLFASWCYYQKTQLGQQVMHHTQLVDSLSVLIVSLDFLVLGMGEVGTV